jgi:hypothetical protein
LSANHASHGNPAARPENEIAGNLSRKRATFKTPADALTAGAIAKVDQVRGKIPTNANSRAPIGPVAIFVFERSLERRT